jgi:hypothetical protein
MPGGTRGLLKMNMLLRLLSTTGDLVVVDPATHNLPPAVVLAVGRRYLRDKTMGDHTGDVPIFTYVEEDIYEVRGGKCESVT